MNKPNLKPNMQNHKMKKLIKLLLFTPLVLTPLFCYSCGAKTNEKIKKDDDIIKATDLILIKKEMQKLKKENEKNKQQLLNNQQKIISFYLVQLAGKDYSDWDSFITKFDDQQWKAQNREIIDDLALALNCLDEQINRDKINALPQAIKDLTIDLLNQKKQENELKIDELIKLIDNLTEKNKNLLDENEKNKQQLLDNQQKIISFYLVQLAGKDYSDWDSFITKFDDQQWKAQNREIIDDLALALNCLDEQINRDKINALPQAIKDLTIDLLNQKKQENELKIDELIKLIDNLTEKNKNLLDENEKIKQDLKELDKSKSNK